MSFLITGFIAGALCVLLYTIIGSIIMMFINKGAYYGPDWGEVWMLTLACGLAGAGINFLFQIHAVAM